MYEMAVDPNSQTWQAVRKAVLQRIDDLTSEAIDLSRSQDQRQESAVRIDELRLLINGPTETLDRTIARHSAEERTKATY